MKKWLVAALFLVGCGGPVYEFPEVEDKPIDAGRYDVVMTATELGCNYLPEESERVWTFYEDDAGGLYVFVEGVKMASTDRQYFFGSLQIPDEPCDVDIEVHSTVEKTDSGGFEGDVMLDVCLGGGFCGDCADYAIIVGEPAEASQ